MQANRLVCGFTLESSMLLSLDGGDSPIVPQTDQRCRSQLRSASGWRCSSSRCHQAFLPDRILAKSSSDHSYRQFTGAVRMDTVNGSVLTDYLHGVLSASRFFSVVRHFFYRRGCPRAGAHVCDGVYRSSPRSGERRYTTRDRMIPGTTKGAGAAQPNGRRRRGCYA